MIAEKPPDAFGPPDILSPPLDLDAPAQYRICAQGVGAFKDLTLDLEELKRQFYEEGMGFDFKTGEISKEKIKELGLQDILS